MAISQRDLRVILSQKEELLLKEIIVQLASVETMLAYNQDLVPLDVFLDYSSFVHNWVWMQAVDYQVDGWVSYNKLKNLIQQLRDWKEQLSYRLIDKYNNPIVLLIKAVQKSQNLFTEITVSNIQDERKTNKTKSTD